MKNEKQIEEEIFERRWLHHAKHESRIFEADDIKKAKKEGWKFWPWEVNIKEKTVKEVEKKEAVIPIEIEEVDFTVSSNTEVTMVNDSVPVSITEKETGCIIDASKNINTHYHGGRVK